ncbi:MAG: hypothetical protein APF76_08410 [Desulfitibacter sp. BRH_c19]|nr:MAG: hypothetical protein APF76_08410 [Desulfitibacter sp. BRH_c19]
MKIKIVIADDHAVLRSGLKMMLNAQNDMEVIGEAATDVETIHSCQTLKPDVLILDLNMPHKGGLKAIPDIRQLSPDTKILVLTMHQDDSYLKDVLKSGGHGYILKNAADLDLLSAIRSVYGNEYYIDSSMTENLLSGFISPTAAKENNESKQILSSRETEVLKLIAQGYTNKQIGDELYISVKTVETHKARISKKLNLSRRSELVRYAFDEGLIEFE